MNPYPADVFWAAMVAKPPNKCYVLMKVSGEQRSPNGWVPVAKTLWVPVARMKTIQHEMDGWRRVKAEVAS